MIATIGTACILVAAPFVLVMAAKLVGYGFVRGVQMAERRKEG